MWPPVVKTDNVYMIMYMLPSSYYLGLVNNKKSGYFLSSLFYHNYGTSVTLMSFLRSLVLKTYQQCWPDFEIRLMMSFFWDEIVTTSYMAQTDVQWTTVVALHGPHWLSQSQYLRVAQIQCLTESQRPSFQ